MLDHTDTMGRDQVGTITRALEQLSGKTQSTAIAIVEAVTGLGKSSVVINVIADTVALSGKKVTVMASAWANITDMMGNLALKNMLRMVSEQFL